MKKYRLCHTYSADDPFGYCSIGLINADTNTTAKCPNKPVVFGIFVGKTIHGWCKEHLYYASKWPGMVIVSKEEAMAFSVMEE